MTPTQSHWSERYVGRPCGIKEGFDCADLAMLVQKEVFHNNITDPGFRSYAGCEGHTIFHQMQEQIKSLMYQYVMPSDTPEDGDPLLLVTRGYMQHIGVYCRINGEPYVLHAADTPRQVVLQKIRDLEIRGLKVEGYYKWI